MASKADTLLKTYREKRDFAKTAEPSGAPSAAKREGLAFVVQKHDATRLHYDFRVEWEGVLKSWAVTRGPSLDPADKRLAVRTEDHPLDYGGFEGTIPKGSYGGGTVMLWDRGTWEPQDDAEEGLAAGNLKMILHGERMTGRWALIRMKPRPKEKRENWLLIKEKDEVADPGTDLLKADRSVATGRTMAAIAKGGDEWSRPTVSPADQEGELAEPLLAKPEKTAKPKRSSPASANRHAPAKPDVKAKPRTGEPPAFRPLQLATLVEAAPAGRDWLHEMKYDGYRILIAVGGGKAKLYTRNELDWTDRFGFLAPTVAALPCDSALIDGEVVAFDADGKTDFSMLQKRLKEKGELSCFCFDLLALDGTDLTAEPLLKRKALLQALLAGTEQKTLLYSEHVTGNGPAVFEQICAAGHEGIISKKADAPYRAGRGKIWVKTKCTRRQEFVIGGFSPSDKKGRAFSSILVGVRDGTSLVYRGRVGSGFGDDVLDMLKARFGPIGRKTSPFSDLPAAIARTSKFVEPRLVAEIDFAEITADGHIRHGVFKGLRDDKPAEEIVDETPKEKADAPKGKPAPERPPARSRAHPAAKAIVAGITLTHPERVVFEAQGLTKLDLARYYEAVAPRMLALSAGRPLSLVRCPGGRQKKCFFQKHASDGFPPAIKAVAVTEKDGGSADYMLVDSAAGLVAAVQMNALEFHIWGSAKGSLEKPDRLVFDLDPDESLGFSDVKLAAFELRDRLAGLGLETFAMVTGGKGVHVVAPLARRQGWEEVKGFSRNVASLIAAEESDRFVATMSKAKRRGRIFIDWLRNERGSTAVAPYSTRSREGAPVAVPVTWDELQALAAANLFTPKDVLQRIEGADPWATYSDVKQQLTATMQKKVAPK